MLPENHRLTHRLGSEHQEIATPNRGRIDSSDYPRAARKSKIGNYQRPCPQDGRRADLVAMRGPRPAAVVLRSANTLKQLAHHFSFQHRQTRQGRPREESLKTGNRDLLLPLLGLVDRRTPPRRHELRHPSAHPHDLAISMWSESILPARLAPEGQPTQNPSSNTKEHAILIK
jgi:hypothetical protein